MKDMEIKKLDWGICSGHFGNSYIASPAIGDPYFIWMTDEGFKCAIPSPGKTHVIKGSLAEAKEFCQKDFESRILECIEAS